METLVRDMKYEESVKKVTKLVARVRGIVDPSELWQSFAVTMNFTNRLCGSTPQNKELVDTWLQARLGKPKANPPASMKSAAEIAQEVLSTIATEDIQEENDEIEKRSTLGFASIGGVLHMRGGTLKAHMKDCARIMTACSGKVEKEKSFAWYILNCLMIGEYYVPIYKNGKKVEKSDGQFDKAVHVMGPRGPVNCLKTIQYIEEPTLSYTVKVMALGGRKVIEPKHIEQVLEYGSMKGYGGERGDGEGRYEYTVKEL